MMSDTNTLLVSFMFITILTLGIAGVLAELAEVVRNVTRKDRDPLLVGWVVLLLFAYFMLFWHTSDITRLEEWNFWRFLFAESGPVLMLLATQIMLGALAAEPESDADMSARQGRFFVIFAQLQAWTLAANFVLGVGFTPGAAISLIILATCLVLAGAKTRGIHALGLAIVSIAYLVMPFVAVRA